MRLSLQTRQIICDTVNEVFGSEASVALFGSRVDDAARGGDIDLLVQSEKLIEQREHKALQLVAKLQIKLGDQPIDVLVIDPQVNRKPVHDVAIRTGVKLEY